MYETYYTNLISYAKFGVPVIEGVFVLLALAWLLLLLSKLIFKTAFKNKLWKALFMTFVAMPSLLEIYIGSLNMLRACSLFMYFSNEESAVLASTGSFHIVFFPLFALFSAAYLFYFFLCLTRQRKQKALLNIENR